ncbi:hypothetical protein TorRG33x02_280370 [Trema orientale]|uniref:Uncharacterized protein n=1 Tax=Trema orientale TaxID=63057 RepID=A0A2P5CLW7_TREOI|nr:hypothetical protein TorRG33x02_280370 [Trema orientale]
MGPAKQAAGPGSAQHGLVLFTGRAWPDPKARSGWAEPSGYKTGPVRVSFLDFRAGPTRPTTIHKTARPDSNFCFGPNGSGRAEPDGPYLQLYF